MVKSQAFKSLTSSASLFAKRDEGSVGMILALCAVPFCMAVALAVDLNRGMHANQRLHDGIDAAVLGAAKLIKDGFASDSEVKTAALAIFKANVEGPGKLSVYSDSDFDVKIDRGNSKVEIELTNAYLPTTFARVGGYDKIPLPQKSTAVFQLRDIEVGLALDVTGSMGSTPAKGGPPKIDTLKSAFAKFATLMLPDNPLPGQKVRLGLAPYSAAANLGSYAGAASANRSKDGCVTERDLGAPDSDGSGTFFVAADGTKDIDDTEGYGGYVCPDAKLVPLSKDRKALIAEVNKYKPGGWTGGHFGAQWAWNVVSPEWGSVWGGPGVPESYAKVSDKKLVKAVILMTDGVFNTAFHDGTSQDQALKLCQNMKNKGVQVFAIAFDAPAGAQAVLKQCATSGPDYYADAGNAQELDNAFTRFAQKINALRLAQ
jgi:Flp pilus assembly protein TadG